MPYSASSGGFYQGTPRRFYDFQTEGVGDLTLEAEWWLTDPNKPKRVQGSVVLGIKSDSGSVAETGTLFTPGGDVEGPVDEAFQLGDGGWGVLLRAQGTAMLGGPWFGYGSAYYLISLEDHYGVMQGGNFRGVPDLYSARLGGAYQIPAYKDLVVMLGGLINGAPVKDLIGGGDLYWRRPGYQVYVEPGVAWTHGKGTFALSYPLRVYQNKQDSLLDESLNRRIGADFAAHLYKVSYSRRF